MHKFWRFISNKRSFEHGFAYNMNIIRICKRWTLYLLLYEMANTWRQIDSLTIYWNRFWFLTVSDFTLNIFINNVILYNDVINIPWTGRSSLSSAQLVELVCLAAYTTLLPLPCDVSFDKKVVRSIFVPFFFPFFFPPETQSYHKMIKFSLKQWISSTISVTMKRWYYSIKYKNTNNYLCPPCLETC